MQSHENTESPSAVAAEMPEPLNTGADLAGHAYALANGATIMTAWVGDSPNDTQRRKVKRVIKEPDYDANVRFLLDPDVSTIFHHPRGSAIYLKRPERINDEGDRLTAYHMTHARAAKALVSLACSRGWTSIVFNGPHDFVMAAMREAVAQGMPVHPRDAAQRLILEQIAGESSGAMGTVAIPAGFIAPAEPAFPHQPIPEPEPPQPAPEAPAAPLLQIASDMASRLAQRRLNRASSDESPDRENTNTTSPKGP